MTNYVQTIGGTLVNGKKYNVENYFVSPMKELCQKTVLTEDGKENINDSYRQHTKYNDKLDCYFSTYDLVSLLHNEESYLEGTIDSSQDVDYYSFSYQEKKLYSKMGISSEITILLESPDSSCNLILYDSYGNQIGMAEDDGNGNKKLTIPDWDCVTSQYIIKVESTDNAQNSENSAYRIKIMETRTKDTQSNSVQHASGIENAGNAENRDEIRNKYEGLYKEQLDRLHKIQFEALPESKKYSGTATVEELLCRMKNGEQLDQKEMAYVKIFANLADYEKAEASNYIHNEFYQRIKEKAEKDGLKVPVGLWEITMNVEGNISVKGDMQEVDREKLEKMLSENFAEDLWNKHMQATDISTEQYRLLNGYHELNKFLQSATNGEYSYKDIAVDKNGKIGGLPDKMCQLFNSQEANARYEELRDDIYMLMDYERKYGMDNIVNFNIKYQASNSELSIIGSTVSMEWPNNIGYYKDMKPIK